MFVAADLESSHEYHEDMPFADVGISCAALYAVEWESAISYPAQDIFGFREPEMSAECAQGFAKELIRYASMGDTIVSFNGLHFDFPLLATVCNDTGIEKELKHLAIYNHIDIGLLMVVARGFMVSLNTAAHALGLSGKTEGMSGYLAPILWNPERTDFTEEELADIEATGVTPGTKAAQNLCLKYVIQDAITTADVYRLLVEDKYLRWTSSRTGRLVKSPWIPEVFEGRLLKVCEVMDRTQLETKWFKNNPFSKDEMLSWALS